MIQSLFILSPVGEVLIERHFRGVVTSRSVCEYFWERASLSAFHHGGVSAASSLRSELYDTVPPVMEVPESDQGTLYVISILRDGLSYLAVCPSEVSPLLVLEFLSRIHSIFVLYFGQADEATLRDGFGTILFLLDEMIDYGGWPLTAEPNSLLAMIRPPTVMSKLLQTVSTAEELPSGTISNMPWRASGVTYSQNEIYIDIVEEVDAIVNGSGQLISTDVSGSIQCQSHLSGVPDLLLTFKDPTLIDDWSFHPCVRYARFENDQIVSFVPPDGDFELMRYRINREQARAFQPPVYCHAQWSYADPTSASSSHHQPAQSFSATAATQFSPSSAPSAGQKTGRIVLQVGITALSSLIFSASRKGPLQVEEVAITIPLPKKTRTSDFRVTLGSIVYDEAGKVARWTLGTLDNVKKPSLSCTFVTTGDEERGNISLTWKVPLSSVSGLTVSGLSITGEAYRCYKGVRNITKSGLFQIRC
jgi:AP-3 complex subunit mu